MEVKEKQNKTAKQLATQKIHANEIHAKLGRPGEDRMRATLKNLQHIVKETLEVFEDWHMAKIKQKFQHKVVEEREPNPGEIIYLDLSLQKKPSYGGSKNWILIQDSDTKQK